jgi:hypothetical protein
MHGSRMKKIDDELLRCELELESMLGTISNTLGCSSYLSSDNTGSYAEITFETGSDTWKIVSTNHKKSSIDSKIFRNGVKMYSLYPSIRESTGVERTASQRPNIHYILHAKNSGALNPSFDGFILKFECIVEAGQDVCCGYAIEEQRKYEISYELTWRLATIKKSSGCAWERFEDEKCLTFGKDLMGSSKVEMSAVTDLNGVGVDELILAWVNSDPILFILFQDIYIQSNIMVSKIKRINPFDTESIISWDEYYKIIEHSVTFGVPFLPTLNWVLLKIVSNRASLTIDHQLSHAHGKSDRFIFDFELSFA